MSGTKSELASRLVTPMGFELSEQELSNAEGRTDPLLKGLLKTWFMEPLSNSSLGLGTMNEPNIFPRIAAFFNQGVLTTFRPGTSCEWAGHQEFGLMCQKNHPWMATSVDALGILRISTGNQTQFPICVVELKTTTNSKTTAAAVTLAHTVGSFKHVRVEDHQLFHQLIPDVSHRVQLVHHMVVIGTNYSIYVVASLGTVGIIRMVFVTISNPLILEYSQIFNTVAENRLGWVYGNDPIPHMTS